MDVFSFNNIHVHSKMLTIVLSDIESILLMNMLHDTLVDASEIDKKLYSSGQFH